MRRDEAKTERAVAVAGYGRCLPELHSCICAVFRAVAHVAFLRLENRSDQQGRSGEAVMFTFRISRPLHPSALRVEGIIGKKWKCKFYTLRAGRGTFR